MSKNAKAARATVKCDKHRTRSKTAWIVCTHITDHTARVYVCERLQGEQVAGHVLCEVCYKTHDRMALRLACPACVVEKFGEPRAHKNIEEITDLFEMFIRDVQSGADTVDLARVLLTYAVVACDRAPDVTFEELLTQVQMDIAKRMGGTSSTEKAPVDVTLN